MPCILTCLVFTNITCTKSGVQQPAVASSEESISNAAVKKPVVYTIAAGGHYSTPDRFVLISKAKISFTALFDSSCIYTLANVSNQDDINKLYGFSDCGSHHLDNSARVGWCWLNNALRLYAFVHNDGEMLMKEITQARIGETIKCSIECNGSNYIFIVNNSTVTMPRHCSKNRFTRYMLYPYFGGDEVAPHKIKITIQDL